MSNASADAETLDALKMILNGRHGREQAITSAELADRIDGLTQSKTHAATKALMRQTDMVVLGTNAGYHLPNSDIDVAEVVRELGERIDGIERRQRLIVDNWAQRRRERGLASDDDTTDSDALTDEEIEQIKTDPVLELSDFTSEAVATDGGVDE